MDEQLKHDFLTKGYVKVDRLIPDSEVETLRIIYDELLADKERTVGLRSDLGGSGGQTGGIEKITQVMRPSSIDTRLLDNMAYRAALEHAKVLLGDDIELDFDMLINKAPNTNTPTPWHQDAAYWIDLPDTRATSCWIALDDVFEDNGCMWFITKSENVVRPHTFYSEGGALQCEANTSAAVSVPLAAGGCTFHDGFTPHFSKGNNTNMQRRALILNFRPKAMIDLERAQGVDHTGERKAMT